MISFLLLFFINLKKHQRTCENNEYYDLDVQRRKYSKRPQTGPTKEELKNITCHMRNISDTYKKGEKNLAESK